MGCLAISFGISRHSRLQIYVVSADVVGGATVTDKTDLTDNNGQWVVTRLQTNACSLHPRRPLGDGVSVLSVKSVMSVFVRKSACQIERKRANKKQLANIRGECRRGRWIDRNGQNGLNRR